jgi:hypothetical protein
MVLVTLSKIIHSVRPSMLMDTVSPPSSSSTGSGILKVNVSLELVDTDEVESSKEAERDELSVKYGLVLRMLT